VSEKKLSYADKLKTWVLLSGLGLEVIGFTALIIGTNSNLNHLRDAGYFLTVGDVLYTLATIWAINLMEKSNRD
jgi:hypothetical protein